MANATEPFKRSLSGSVGAGMGSLFNGSGRTYFVLEHKVSSKYHKAGEAQEIIVDQVELGRDSKCAVQFDESFSTVSRRHAAIVRDGQNWKLVQLSTVNQTFLNGRPVQKEWYLQNGDEIQLSVNGPKLGFIIPTGNKSTVGSIGLSRRLSLFRQQALKPYKTAMVSMAVIIILLLAGGITYGVLDHQHDLLVAEMSQEQLDKLRKDSEDAINKANAESQNLRAQLSRVSANYDQLKQALDNGYHRGKVDDNTPVSIVYPEEMTEIINKCKPNVYYVYIRKIVAEYQGQTKVLEDIGHGTGFLLNDGRFITARHVVRPWDYPDDENDETSLALNFISNNGGTVTCYLEAYSPTGERFAFTSSQTKVNTVSDETFSTEVGNLVLPQNFAYDYAIYNRGDGSHGLKFDNSLSGGLPAKAQLMVLGYPMNFGVNSADDISPLYSEAVVAKAGLDNGRIITTATTFEHGNSGGPVFAIVGDNNPVVVGIVSAGAGRSTGIVVPICNIK